MFRVALLAALSVLLVAVAHADYDGQRWESRYADGYMRNMLGAQLELQEGGCESWTWKPSNAEEWEWTEAHMSVRWKRTAEDSVLFHAVLLGNRRSSTMRMVFLTLKGEVIEDLELPLAVADASGVRAEPSLAFLDDTLIACGIDATSRKQVRCLLYYMPASRVWSDLEFDGERISSVMLNHVDDFTIFNDFNFTKIQMSAEQVPVPFLKPLGTRQVFGSGEPLDLDFAAHVVGFADVFVSTFNRTSGAWMASQVDTSQSSGFPILNQVELYGRNSFAMYSEDEELMIVSPDRPECLRWYSAMYYTQRREICLTEAIESVMGDWRHEIVFAVSKEAVTAIYAAKDDISQDPYVLWRQPVSSGPFRISALQYYTEWSKRGLSLPETLAIAVPRDDSFVVLDYADGREITDQQLPAKLVTAWSGADAVVTLLADTSMHVYCMPNAI